MGNEPLSQAESYLERVGLIDAPGVALYSSQDTLRPGPIYLLGLNPGGSAGSTLRDSIELARAGRNAYLDEQWAPGGHLRPSGKAPLQQRIQKLCAEMGLDVRSVPASNLVLTRSTRIATHLGFGPSIPHCFPVHQIFMDAIQPSFLMTFGSINNFRRVMTVTHVENRSAEHGNWQAYRGEAIFGGHKINFGNVPHMSLWASDKRPEVVRWAIQNLV